MSKKKMSFNAFLLALDVGKNARTVKTYLNWMTGKSSTRSLTLEEQVEELQAYYRVTAENEFPACCGITCITDVGGISDLSIQVAAHDARQSGYTVAMATDVAKNRNKVVFLRNGWTITKTFRNRRTGNTLNVYTLDLYPLPDYAALLASLQSTDKSKRISSKEGAI